ncbi:MAG: SusD/RagB family nutrient-binding outer membrane lipoprotein [Saprospiraceae bacterium]|nr:SusD/RagB family nutrient-binding outer membrane lipoprotein [Saprospiraceae bacterium]
MKNILKLNIVLCIILFGSCNDWLDVNTDPNNPSQVSLDLILPNAQMQIASAMAGDYALLGGLWSQHWTQSHIASQYKDIDSYDLTDKDLEIAWTEMFSDGLVDFEEIKRQASASGNWNAYLQAVCMQTYGFQILADFYDKIPYTEALKGESLSKPKWDDGEVVYDGMIAALNEALSKDFSAATNTALTTDFVFGGTNRTAQISSWVKFANTLKLKIYLRQTESARKADALVKIKDLLATNNFLQEAATIDVFIDEANRSNPLYENNVRQLNVATNLRASFTFLSFLQLHADPRLDAYFTTGATGHFALAQGDFNELTSVTPGDKTSKANFSPTTPVYLFSLDEIHFMLAEANLRAGNSSDESNYYDGVKAAFNKFGLTAPQSLLDGDYKYPSGGTFDQKLEAIIVQKWAGSVNQGHESYFDHNRTGYPRISSVPAYNPNGEVNPSYIPGQFTYSIQGVTGGAFPKRLIYPDISRRVNPNTPAFTPITTKVWWAK